jgi:hypothetical protein
MKPQEVIEIIECLPKGRTLYHYFKDRYALQLLSWFVGEGRTVREVKTSPFARLLQRPTARDCIARLGGGRLTRLDLEGVWPARPEAFVLTLGTWGRRRVPRRWGRGYYQTSRPGVNLVLQMNFCNRHEQEYAKLAVEEGRRPFECFSHPIHQNGRRTLAWARLDLDLGAGEALIEEIQSDWVRDALYYRGLCDPSGPSAADVEPARYGFGCGIRRLRRYLDRFCAQFLPIWDEAMLSAAIWFLRRELGVRRIFYHTFASGNVLKRIRWSHPPRSLYTRLPRRFCFRVVDTGPGFLAAQLRPRRPRRRRRRPVDLRFFVLEL